MASSFTRTRNISVPTKPLIVPVSSCCGRTSSEVVRMSCSGTPSPVMAWRTALAFRLTASSAAVAEDASVETPRVATSTSGRTSTVPMPVTSRPPAPCPSPVGG